MNTQEQVKNIKPGMPVVCSEDGQFAVVDNKVHVDRPGDQAMKDWKTAS